MWIRRYFRQQDIAEMKLPWEKLQGKNILVTGANGLIASNLVDALMSVSEERQLGIALYALCRNCDKAQRRFGMYMGSAGFHLIAQDVSEPLRTNVEFDYIFHAASSAHPKAFNDTPVDVMKANFLGTLNLLEYAKGYPGSRFVFVSSSEVYGENAEGAEMFRENDPGIVDYTKFRSCYPESKRASETLCMSYKKQYGSDIVVVRPAFIYGREILDTNTRADVYFLRQVLNHEDIVMYSEGTQVRSYCYVKDCVAGMLYAALLGESGEVYNIGDMNGVVTLREYAALLAKHGGVELRYEPKTAPGGTVFLKTTRCVLDTGKLEGLGWKARYTLDDGIQDILKEER